MSSSEQAIRRALEYHRSGQLGPAEAIYRQVLEREPDHPDALNLLGLLAHQVGKSEAAIQLIARAIAIDDRNPGYHNNIGLVYRALRQSDKAEAAFRQAVALKHDFAEAHSNLGNALQDQGRFAEAAEAYRRALTLRPDLAEIHVNLGNTLGKVSRKEEAIQCYRRAVMLKPDRSEFYNNLGNALREAGRVAEAMDCYRKAIGLKPDSAQVYFNLGVSYTHERGFDDAIACYQKAIAINPAYMEAHLNLGTTMLRTGRVEASLAAFQRVIELAPDAASAYSNRLFALLCRAGDRPEEIFPAHREFAVRFESRSKPSRPVYPNTRDPERRLKIGYVSPDFRLHSVAMFMEPILDHHDRRQVEVYGYYSHATEDSVTARLRRAFDHWLNCNELSDEQLAARIGADGIDILIDLAGHTAGNRLMVLARRPAPVQVTYLGYPTTTGLSAVDYRLTTHDIDPEGSEAWYSERLYRLPRTLWCYRSALGLAGQAGPAPLVAKGYPTFGSTNHPAKISPETVALWSEILRRLPGSRLLMTSVPEGGARESLLERFAHHGVRPEALIVHGRLPTEDFRALTQEIDVALDPFPYNGTTTTCEALWMGIPVVTRVGKASVSRSGYALLKAIGLQELCGRDEAEYAQIVIDLVRDPQRLCELRHGMQARLEASPLRDEIGMARDIETAYRTMWRRWCASDGARGGP
jgi:protein O-GlcNAc transferase